MPEQPSPAQTPVANLPDLDAFASAAFLEATGPLGVTQEMIRNWMRQVMVGTHDAMRAHYAWQPIETAPLDHDNLDLFGYIDYDKHEFRLIGCEFKHGEWYCFSAGKSVPVAELSYTPTHWMIPPGPAWEDTPALA